MMTINLLPDDYKVEESTSPVKLLSIGASALISLAALVFFCVVHFYELPNTEDMLSQAKPSVSPCANSSSNTRHSTRS